MRVLGTPIKAILDTEDRQLFVDRLNDNPLGPFKQREVNLLAVMANSAAVAIVEAQRSLLLAENRQLRDKLKPSAGAYDTKVAGIVSGAGVAPLPEAEFPTIQVTAQLPGASPDTMASSVATPLEVQFSAIPGMTQMTSSSALGSTTLTLQFTLDKSIDTAAQEVQAAINTASGKLPKDMPISVNDVSTWSWG